MTLVDQAYNMEVNMFRRLRRTVIATVSLALIVLAVIAPATSSAAPVAAPQAAAAPDFWFVLSYNTANWFDPSYVVRGDVSNYPGPHYELCVYGCFWSDNSARLWSRSGGFSGTVTLEYLNLPPGITAEMPTSVFVPKFGAGPSFSVKLRATAAAALGNVSNVTFRARSGSIVHTVVLPTFTVVDQLPPLH
jgi:hypothetical protein